MIHFIRPFWLYALFPAILYFIWIVISKRQTNPWKKVCDPHLLPELLQPGKNTTGLFTHLCLFLFFLISIFALAGPSWHKTKLPIYRDVSSLMLVLDLSSAMQSADLKPDRLTRAKFKIRDLINAAQNTQMGLVAFTQEAFTASPLSQDANTLNIMVDELDPRMMPVPGSDISQGLNQGLTLLKQAGVLHSHLLLITASEPSDSSFAAAKSLSDAGNKLTVLAMLESNSDTAATISKLQQLAETGGGAFYLFSPETRDIQQILSSTTKQSVKDEDIDNASLWQDAGPWFCLLLIPFALIVLREKVRHESHQ